MQARTRSIVVGVIAALMPVSAQAQIATARIDSGALIRMWLSGTESVRGRLLQPFAPSDTVLTSCRYPAVPCVSRSDPHVQTIAAARVT